MSFESSIPPKGSKRIKRGLVRTMPPKSTKVPAAASRPDESRDASNTEPIGQPHNYSVGKRVMFEADGVRGSGVVDDVMHDGSVVWIWPDDAMGRKMLSVADSVVVAFEEPSA
jgi:hypothetical protein